MSVLPSLCVAARSERPATSNQCLFHVDELPHLVFCAYAVVGGTVVVQQVGIKGLRKHQVHAPLACSVCLGACCCIKTREQDLTQ